MKSFPQPSERLLRGFFLGLAAIHLGIGVWMFAAPHSFFGVAAPLETPPHVIGEMNSAINRSLNLPEVRSRFRTLGVRPAGGTPKEFEEFVLYRLDRVFGLEPASPFYRLALGDLADDFYGWGQSEEASKNFDIVADSQKGQVFIRCKSSEVQLMPLEPVTAVWHHRPADE